MILWGLSRDFVVPFTDTVIPGFLVWLVIAYAVVGTWLTHLIGRPLIGLDFRQEKVEADFRFSLARYRIYSEQIALLRGERAEASRLTTLFHAIIDNYLGIIFRRDQARRSFTLRYSQTSVVFPDILAAPSLLPQEDHPRRSSSRPRRPSRRCRARCRSSSTPTRRSPPTRPTPTASAPSSAAMTQGRGARSAGYGLGQGNASRPAT